MSQGTKAGIAPHGPLTQSLGAARIPGLDFLRAVAVILVLLDHSGLYGIRVGPFVLVDGTFGVTMFFVISGFLITKILLDEHERTATIGLAAFYRRRAARLLPAFYAYLIGGLALLLLRDAPVPWPVVLASAFYVVNYYQGLTGGEPNYLSHCWSLAVEEQFYLVWPLALLALLKARRSLVRFLLATILFVWLLKILLMGILGVPEPYVYRALETRADQLAIGCLLAVVLRQEKWRRLFESVDTRAAWVPLVLVAAILASLGLNRFTLLQKHVIGYSLEPWLVAALIPFVILAASRAGTVTSALLNARSLVLAGQISYGIYLFHPFVMHPVRKVIERATGMAPLAIVGSILAVAAVAYVSFRCFEQPLRRRLSGTAAPTHDPTGPAVTLRPGGIPRPADGG